jgi:hypothetical protein
MDPNWQAQIENAGIKPHVCGFHLVVSYPNGGEALEQSGTYTISWSSNVGGNVKIELFKGGSLNKEITSSAPNNESFEWEITTDYSVGDDYKLKISSIENDTIVGESSNNFSIIEEFIVAIPYTQNFDTWSVDTKAMDNWEQLSDDDIDWTIQTGPTPSRIGSTPDQTGAESDHTSGDGKYIYIEASDPNNPDKAASIITPKFDFRTLQNPTLTLYYHMLSVGNEMGSFYVDVKVGDNNWQEKIVEITGNQGDEWKVQTIDLTSITNNDQRVMFRLRGVTGSSWQSDICIDDFQIHEEIVPVNTIVKKGPNYHLGFANSVLRYRIPESNELTHVNIRLFNAQGKEIKTFVNKAQESGEYFVKLNNLAKGVYLCRMEAFGFQKTIKILSK